MANQTEGQIKWIHRRDGDVDIYFVCNQDPEKPVQLDLAWADGMWLNPGGSEFIVMRGETRLPISLNEDIVSVDVNLAAVQTIDGPWTVNFQEDRGAPEQIEMDELCDWINHPDKSVNYFSGTARYHVKADISLPTDGSQIFLDLGQVKNMAEVIVNGQNCGLLWQRPFIADITDAVKDGQNDIEIRVTNLWANRMIGDEFEPDDIVWDKPARYSYAPGNPYIGSTIQEVPEWLEKNLPRPSQGRHAIISYKFFSKDAPLKSSGLLGPVRVCATAPNGE